MKWIERPQVMRVGRMPGEFALKITHQNTIHVVGDSFLFLSVNLEDFDSRE